MRVSSLPPPTTSPAMLAVPQPSSLAEVLLSLLGRRQGTSRALRVRRGGAQEINREADGAGGHLKGGGERGGEEVVATTPAKECAYPHKHRHTDTHAQQLLLTGAMRGSWTDASAKSLTAVPPQRPRPYPRRECGGGEMRDGSASAAVGCTDAQAQHAHMQTHTHTHIHTRRHACTSRTHTQRGERDTEAFAFLLSQAHTHTILPTHSTQQ